MKSFKKFSLFGLLCLISLTACHKSRTIWSVPQEIKNFGSSRMPLLDQNSVTANHSTELMYGSETAEKKIGDSGYNSTINLATFNTDGVLESDQELSEPGVLARGTFIISDASGRSYAFWGERRVSVKPPVAPSDGLMSDLIFSESSEGNHWSPGQSIYHVSSNSLTSLMWVPVSGTVDNNGTVHIAFYTSTPYRIHYSNQPSGGSWSSFRTLFTGFDPYLTSDSEGILYMAFLGNDTTKHTPNLNSVFFSKSTNGGRNWETPTLVHLGSEQHGGQRPQIWVTNNGRINIMWQAYSNYGQQLAPDQLWHIWSADGGSHWSTPTQVPGMPTGQLIYSISGVKLPNDNYYIAYVTWNYPSDPNQSTLYVRHWDENNSMWSRPKILAQGEHVRGEVSLTYDSKAKHVDVIWDQYDKSKNSTTFQLYYAYKDLSTVHMPQPNLVSGVVDLLH